MALFGKKKQPEAKAEIPPVYSENDMSAYIHMISDSLGKITEVLRDDGAHGLNVDLLVISPDEGRDFFTLVTVGAGAYRMPVPPRYGSLNRAEFALRLPRSQVPAGEALRRSWPVGMLRNLARLAYSHRSWVGMYHDIDFGAPFSEETKLCAVLTDVFDEGAEPLTLEGGDRLVLYNAIPLYRPEIEYIEAEGPEALLELMSDDMIYGPVDIKRDCVVK